VCARSTAIHNDAVNRNNVTRKKARMHVRK
jgi:hypothetical protein